MKNFLQLTMQTLFVACLISITAVGAAAQRNANSRALDDANAAKPDDLSVDEKLRRMEELIERQQQDIKQLRSLVEKLAAKDASVAPTPTIAANTESARSAAGEGTSVQPATEPAKKEVTLPDNLKISGDIRLRMESFSNQGFDSPTEATSRNRVRLRARLDITGKFNSKFDWGLKLATGTFTDPISTNQTLTDFMNASHSR